MGLPRGLKEGPGVKVTRGPPPREQALESSRAPAVTVNHHGSEAARTGVSLKANVSRLQTALWRAAGRSAGRCRQSALVRLVNRDCFEGSREL